jgi:hypothetical protein
MRYCSRDELTSEPRTNQAVADTKLGQGYGGSPKTPALKSDTTARLFLAAPSRNRRLRGPLQARFLHLASILFQPCPPATSGDQQRPAATSRRGDTGPS